MSRAHLAFFMIASLSTIGCNSETSRPAIKPGHLFALRRATLEPERDGWGKTETLEGEVVYMEPTDVVTSHGVELVHESEDTRGRLAMGLRLNKDAGRRLYKATYKPEGLLIVIVVDDQAIKAIPVSSRMQRDIQISGEFTPEEIDNWYRVITGYERGK